MNGNIQFTPGEVSTYYAARVPHLKQKGAAEWRGACPIHHGKNENFAVEPDTGRWFCHSTCGRGGDILELEAALSGGDFPTRKAEVFRLVGRMEPDYRRNGNRTNGNSAGAWREVARYPYVDQDGNLLFEVVRYLKPLGEKAFRQCRPDGRGGVIWNQDGIERVPYRLPKLLANKERVVFLAEGEKDVHTLEGWGLVASCNPGGSGSSGLYSQWADHFRGRDIVILPDNDEPGRKHAAAVAAALLDAAASVRIVELPAYRRRAMLPTGAMRVARSSYSVKSSVKLAPLMRRRSPSCARGGAWRTNNRAWNRRTNGRTRSRSKANLLLCKPSLKTYSRIRSVPW